MLAATILNAPLAASLAATILNAAQEYAVHTDGQTINKGATLIPILSHPILTRVILTLVAEPYKSKTLVQA